MKEEVLSFLSPLERKPSLLIDCTLGEGGHTEAFLTRYPELRVIGVDRDSAILEKAVYRLRDFSDRFTAVNAWSDEFLENYTGDKPDRILFDLGISVFHYEESGRGFSFSRSEELDMRLDKNQAFSVADIVNTYPECELADVIYEYGEERYSRRIARAIAERRNSGPIEKSDELAELIRSSVPADYRWGRIHPATRTFQALRIAVNRELDRIEPELKRAIELVGEKGRVGVITFHSLEDRIAKWCFKGEESAGRVTILTKHPVIPTEEECRVNSPSRSAKLRVVEKKGQI